MSEPAEFKLVTFQQSLDIGSTQAGLRGDP
jgi:hypothetical protein